MSGRHWNLIVGIFLLFSIGICFGVSTPILVQADTQSSEPIKILFVMDDDYGANYAFIRTIIERFGWEITTTALVPTIYGCAYEGGTPLDVDVLISDISDVTEYDILSIMPGSSHENLRVNSTALSLIQNAVSQNLIVSAWCRAVRVLAAADVINGRNVTGHADYQAEYEAAGATFFELVPPVTDGNIITSVRSRFYREEMCYTIAAAVDFYDENPPTFESIAITPSPTAVGVNTTFTVSLDDEAIVHMVNCKIYALNETGGKEELYTYNLGMDPTEQAGEFNLIVTDLEIGNYTVDIEAWDCFMNYAEYLDAAGFTVLTEIPTTSTNTSTEGLNLSQLMVPGAIAGGVGIVLIVAVVVLKRK